MAKSAKLIKEKQTPTGKVGAPQEFDRTAFTAAICTRLAVGEPMTIICRDLMVPVRTVNKWRMADETIRHQFDDARDLGYDAIGHNCVTIADDGRRDYVIEDGRKVVDHDHISRSKLRIDTRLKLLAKWDPRRYGDKVQLADADGNKLPAHQLSDSELIAIIGRTAKDADRG